MRNFILVPLYFLVFSSCLAQRTDSTLFRYQNCFNDLESILENNDSFKKAVFVTENCFMENEMHYDSFNHHINQLVEIIKLRALANPISNYHFKDSIDVQNNFEIFRFITDTTKIDVEKNNYFLLPYTYDFNDFFGKENWTNMFVTKLLSTHKGNCHSLPFLYKILADELNAKCWLALAPNHIYIRNRCKGIGWYNTELTSGNFPIDAWITGPGYIPVKAIQAGLYMDTLNNQQAIALCVLDLAKGYEHQAKNYYDGFILKCCDLVLKYHSVNPQALLLKAETLKKVYEKQKQEQVEEASITFDKMQQTYIQLYDLGYREMPEKMYLDWLVSIQKQQSKFRNKALEKTIKNN